MITIDTIENDIEKLESLVRWLKVRKAMRAIAPDVVIVICKSTSEYDDESYTLNYTIDGFTRDMRPVYQSNDPAVAHRLGLPAFTGEYMYEYNNDYDYTYAFNLDAPPTLPEWMNV